MCCSEGKGEIGLGFQESLCGQGPGGGRAVGFNSSEEGCEVTGQTCDSGVDGEQGLAYRGFSTAFPLLGR